MRMKLAIRFDRSWYNVSTLIILTAATGQHTVTTTNHNDLVCGDHVCHGHQVRIYNIYFQISSVTTGQFKLFLATDIACVNITKVI